MKKMLAKLSLFLLLPVQLFGTAQAPDYVIYKGDTLPLYACPLNAYPDSKLITPKKLFGDTSGECFSTGCWRGYIATWEFVDNQLYLVQIRNACFPTTLQNVAASFQVNRGKDSTGTALADLQALFPDRYENGRVKADWVTDTLYSPQGKLLYYIHAGFESIYEREREFIVEHGILRETNMLDNSKTRKSKYADNSTSLMMDFIAEHINYDNLPAGDTIERRVILYAGSWNNSGKIDSVRVLRGVNEWYDKEAVRVVKSIPEWDILYRHGKKTNGFSWSIPVVFNRTKQK